LDFVFKRRTEVGFYKACEIVAVVSRVLVCLFVFICVCVCLFERGEVKGNEKD
jgi:hypothetical protein